MNVAVTGATGFVGRSLLASLISAGARPIALGRRPVPHVETRAFTLGETIQPSLLNHVDTLVHCAWDLSCNRLEDIYARNVVGSTELLKAANVAGVGRIIFLSSMSAYAGTGQIYGRTKLEIEQVVSDLGGVSLRLGLVWGDRPGGMAGAVQRLTRLPVVPMLGGRSYQFTAHEGDVDAAIHAAALHPGLTGVLGVANPTPVPTPQLLSGLAALAGGRPGRLVAVPWGAVYWTMRLAETARLPLPIHADSVLGLVRPAPSVPRYEEWEQYGVRLRPFQGLEAAQFAR